MGKNKGRGGNMKIFLLGFWIGAIWGFIMGIMLWVGKE